MISALLLVDVQEDFLGRVGLVPERGAFIAAAAHLLQAARENRIPVFHAITEIGVDGSGRMPHWIARDIRQCVQGTEGAGAPPDLAAIAGEAVLVKPFFSAFGNPNLLNALQASGVEHIVIAGLYTHACIRASALDAYQAGLAVTLAVDALASCEQEHARISLDYLAGRAVRLAQVGTIVEGFAGAPATDTTADAGTETDHPAMPYWEQRNPSNWSEILGRQAIDGPQQIGAAVRHAQNWQSEWAASSLAQRHQHLQSWAEAIAARREQFVMLMAREIGKPRAAAVAEVDYALALLHHCNSLGDWEQSDPGAITRYRPIGVIAAITPWNNPLAIPVGKLAPALRYGNAVLWKPAPQATSISALLHESLVAAGLADGVRIIHGGQTTGQWLARAAGIAALSFTGSIRNGQQLALLCTAASPTPRPLQAELGGNNAVLVMADADLERAASEVVEASFSFSGQRCTAPRRIIVEQSIKPAFEAALKTAAEALPTGLPDDPATVIGPVISRQKQQQLLASVQSALAAGARLVCGGSVPPGLEAGCWMQPTILSDARPDSSIVRDESFGPIAVVLAARDIDDALELCNDVEHGLVASLFSNDPEIQRRFAAGAQAGILSLNQARPPFSGSAPFSGWKASGIGHPEHGRWARDFYSRTQAAYGAWGIGIQAPEIKGAF